MMVRLFDRIGAHATARYRTTQIASSTRKSVFTPGP